MSKVGTSDSKNTLYCSFCGKSQHEVRKLIAGPTVFICDECVELCMDIIREENKSSLVKSRDGIPTPREIRKVLDLSLIHIFYNTWPLIDGTFVPDTARLFFAVPLWRNFFENTLTVQFDHRMLAYAIFVGALVHAFDVERSVKHAAARVGAFALFAAVTLQVALGKMCIRDRTKVASMTRTRPASTIGDKADS